MPPLVSIVTPSFNQAPYLEQTLRSVLEQDYPAIEYFVMDGGSTDGSVKIIQRYAHRLAGWVSEPDRGQADAINKGFARAHGEIVAWLNSDDLYLPGAVRAAVEIFERHPQAGMVFGDVVSIDGEGNPIHVMTFGDWGLEELMQFRIISQPGVFVRRQVLEQAGLLDLSYHYLLDHHLWLRCAQVAPMVYLRQRLACARFHPLAKNVAQAARFGQEAYRLVEWMAQEPALAERFRRLEKPIRAGAHRLNARYLLDAGLIRPAASAYTRSLLTHAPTALVEWRRILFAYARLLVNVEGLKRLYLRARRRRMRL